MSWWWVHRKFSNGMVVSVQVQAPSSGQATILSMNFALVAACRRMSQVSHIYVRPARTD